MEEKLNEANAAVGRLAKIREDDSQRLQAMDDELKKEKDTEEKLAAQQAALQKQVPEEEWTSCVLCRTRPGSFMSRPWHWKNQNSIWP